MISGSGLARFWRMMRGADRATHEVRVSISALDPESVDWAKVAQRIRDELLKPKPHDDDPPAGIT